MLYRRRLVDLLEKNEEKKLILILGQAAQGKSTLAASYAKTSRIPFAWMNLGPEDSDPVNFFFLIVHSIQHTFKDIDFFFSPRTDSEVFDPILYPRSD